MLVFQLVIEVNSMCRPSTNDKRSKQTQSFVMKGLPAPYYQSG